MRKFLSVIICAVIVFGAFSPKTFAASDVTIELSKREIAMGDAFTVTAFITGDNVTADKIDVTVSYPSQVQLTSFFFNGGQVTAAPSTSPATLTATYAAPANLSGLFITLNFISVDFMNGVNISVNTVFTNGSAEVLRTGGGVGYAYNCAIHTYSEWQTATTATCLTEGKETRICNKCGEKEERIIPKTDHLYKSKEILRQPTCIDPGYQRAFCIYCEQKLLEEIAPTGHTFSNPTVITAPTCSQKGLNEKICYTCGHKEYIETDSTGHYMGEWQTVTAPTCSGEGYLESVCSYCGYKEYKTIEAVGHNMSEWVIITPATCTQNGLKEKTCLLCGIKENEEIAATGHNMSEWAIETEATCTVKEVQVSVCANCSLKDIKEGEALGHKFKEAVVTTEPTIGKYGIKTGYCERCDETTEANVECAYTDTATNIHIDTTHGVFPENAKVKIEAVKENFSSHKSIKEALAHITNQFYGYNINITNMGFSVNPEGEATISFPIPEKFGKHSAFYFINDDGSVKKLSAKLSEDSKTAAVKFINSGRYAICKTEYSVDGEFISPASVNGRLIIVIAAIAMVVCWVIVILSIIKQKNPKLYKKIIRFFPTFSEIKNYIKRNIFIISEKIKKPH